MDTAALLNQLFQRHRFGIRPGLERIEHLLRLLGNPHRRYPIVHVTGTNGKGSVCALVAAALHAQGYRVGLYTSPHLCRFNERIQIGGAPVDDSSLVELLPWLLSEADAVGATFFEVTTALAFALFARHAVDVAVVEVGMGGRYDATNVVEPLVAVITGVDYDHQDYLGRTLEDIAWQKVGIVKPGRPAVIGEVRPHVRELLCRWAQESGASTIIVPEPNFQLIAATPELQQHIRLPNGSELVLPLAGEHQQRNLAIALAVRELLADEFPISDEAFAEGVRNVRRWGALRARIEPIRLQPPVIVDVAHNPGGIAALLKALELHGYGAVHWNVVFGAMADKDVEGMLRLLASHVQELFACAPQTERALPAEQLCAIARTCGIAAEPVGSVADAVDRAWQKGEPCLIVGSFYVAGEALPVLEELCADL